MYDMNSIKHIELKDIPDAWIYKYYYEEVTNTEITQPFDGRIIKVKSLVTRDSNPSLCFFCKDRRYYWKDFSSGKGGDAVDFVVYCDSKYRSVVISKIISDYERFIQDKRFYKIEDYQIYSKRKFFPKAVTFEKEHEDFWSEGKISINSLLRFNIFALNGYVMKSDECTKSSNKFCFGFYCKDGLYQIYQPKESKAKYLTVNSGYLIGSEQLNFKSDTCAIISGLKDIAAISELKLDCEYVAPNSESIILKSSTIDLLKYKYKNIVSILDNDNTGKKMMMMYKKVYGINPVIINLEKDLFDNNKNHDLEYLKSKYSFEINKVINK